MKKKKLLAGTRVYINNDLTKEQMAQERKIREKDNNLGDTRALKKRKLEYIKENFGRMVTSLMK